MKLNKKRTILVGLAFLSISAFWQVYDGIIPLILKYTFGYGDTFSNAIMSVDNILALFMLPLFGVLSDKTNTKIGRRMPYILGGTAAAVAAMVLIPIANNAKNFVLFFISLGVVLVAMATYRSPAVALMPDVTPKPLRSQGNAVINLMGAVGGTLMLGLITVVVPKVDHPDYTPIFLIAAALMAGCVAVLFFTVNEPRTVASMREESRAMGIEEEPEATGAGDDKLPKDVLRSLILIVLTVFFFFMGYNAVTTAFSRYCVEVFGLKGGGYAQVLLIAQVAAIVSYLPVGWVSGRIGRRRTIMIGLALMGVAFLGASFVSELTPVVYIFFILAGAGNAFVVVNTLVMVVEMSKGATIGKYTGLYYTFSMTAQIITPIVSGAVLEFISYRYLFPYAAFFEFVGIVTMLFVRHGDSRPQPPKSTLEAFDVED
ncbi:MAG: MFS transporter [Oscillospiraceae bacterium]|nr:MFS transporter [Oscillospiraceae bacterium]